ncbi:MAG: ADP-ribosylglycohydrolase family protein [Bacteroidales bacterium]
MIDFKSRVYGGVIGSCVGDALGVPVEFKSRASLHLNPVKEMIGFGTYNQPPGTWSDDSSLTFCTMESLCGGYQLEDIARNFGKWRNESFWTPYGIVFDIGISTNKAIIKLSSVKNPIQAGNTEENSNGNGSLMRILPLAFYFKKISPDERFLKTKEVSSITHAHTRSVMACVIYIEFATLLLEGIDKYSAYQETLKIADALFKNSQVKNSEFEPFKRIFDGQIQTLDENRVSSSGYVIDSLEVAFWSLLTTSDYKQAVLKAINLGGDTDTNGAITGGLAGLYYGYDSIPKEWIKKLARLNDITKLTERFFTSINS